MIKKKTLLAQFFEDYHRVIVRVIVCTLATVLYGFLAVRTGIFLCSLGFSVSHVIWTIILCTLMLCSALSLLFLCMKVIWVLVRRLDCRACLPITANELLSISNKPLDAFSYVFVSMLYRGTRAAPVSSALTGEEWRKFLRLLENAYADQIKALNMTLLQVATTNCIGPYNANVWYADIFENGTNQEDNPNAIVGISEDMIDRCNVLLANKKLDLEMYLHEYQDNDGVIRREWRID